MELNTDTFLVTVYCIVDDLYREHIAPHKPVRRGQPDELSDSEVLTLMLLAQWHPSRSESAFLRYAAQHWRAYFPRLLDQSAFTRRARDLAGVLAAFGPLLHARLVEALGRAGRYRVVDGVPVPLMRLCRGRRHRLFAHEAAVGYGGSDKAYYYGVKLLSVVSDLGTVTGFVCGPADTDERWLTEALLHWREDPTAPPPTASALAPALGPSKKVKGARRGPTGPLGPALGAGPGERGPFVGDLGFSGQRWNAHWAQAYGVQMLTRADYAECPASQREPASQWLSHWRQVVETVFDGLSETFGLKFPRARSLWGVWTRLSAKVAAHNLAVYINHLFGRPTFAVFNPFG
jgi:ribosome modulation factor